MNWLADFEDVLCEGCIYDKNLPGPRHEYTPEERGDYIDHTNVEDN